MIPIKYVCPFLVWGFAAYLVINKFQPRHYKEALEHFALIQMLTSLPAVAFLLVVFSSSPISVGFLIGKGTAVLCPIVSTCLMPLLKVDEKFTLLGFALVFFYSPNICFSSFYHLPAPFQKIHKRFLVTHGAMIFLLIKNYRAETAGICFMQAVMWLLSFVAIHEFSSVYWADLRLREDFLNFDYEEEQDIPGAEADYDFPVVEQEPEIQNDGQNIEDHNLEAPHELLRNMEQLIKTPSGCECKICLVEYSTTRIPRMLSGCGHTICEKCAGQLLKNGSTSFITFYKASRSIRCPFCREGTVVRGSVQQMPKNYELMKVIGI